MAHQTFAQYLISKILPPDITVTKQIDKSYLNEILTAVATKHPDQYDTVVSNLKRLADHMSTMEAVTIGLDEIDVPNKAKRDSIIKKYQKQLSIDKKKGDQKVLITHLGDLQHELAKNDLDGTKDDASVMVRSSLTGKKAQLMKMRTSPGVVSDHSGNIVPEIFTKSYAQGQDPLQFWLGAAESRKNIAEGQVNTAKPGEMNKVLSNVLSGSVVSVADCGTQQGIFLATRDDAVIDRYLARNTGRFKRNTLITPDIQQELLRTGVTNILVRSPQTCSGKDGSVCQMCMGLRPGTGKKYEIGDNAGLITAGNIGEPLTQMTLSAKHSTSLAEVHDELHGESGFRQFIESPENYPNRKILCEVIGVIHRITPAAQGGKKIIIRQTRPVPERYILFGERDKDMRGFWNYYIPPNLKLAEGLAAGMEVWPGMELSTGTDNLKDSARLRNLGFTRSVAAQGMYQVYKNTGMKLDRRHFELLARAANPYVRVVKAPRGYGLLPGETVKYQDLVQKVKLMPRKTVPVSSAMGSVLGEGVLNVTVGTEIDSQVMRYFMDNDVKQVSICDGLEVEAVSVPLTRVVNQSGNWLAAMNHRYLKTNLRDAALHGQSSNIHGYSPVAAYAYGAELGHGEEGRY
jgi:DNA-directed RNA polymerase subunit beta'